MASACRPLLWMILLLCSFPGGSPADGGAQEALLRASLVGSGAEVPSEPGDDLEEPVRRLVSFDELRAGMREELKQFEEEEFALRPQQVRPPLRGSGALLSPDFVDTRASRRPVPSEASSPGREPDPKEEVANDEQHTMDGNESDPLAGLLSDELIEAHVTRMCEQEREEQEARQEEEYAGHFLDRALAQAVYKDDTATVDDLVRRGASVNRWLPEDDDQLEPNALGVAAGAGNIPMAERLIALGADLNRHNGKGYRALHFAVFSRSVQMCRMLVDRGAELGAVDYWGDQPIDRAEAGGQEFRALYTWMESEMRRRNIGRVYGNMLLNPDQRAEMERVKVEEAGTASKREHKAESAGERRARQASAQRMQRLKREGVLPQDYDEVMTRYHRNSAEDRLWLEKRFLLHLWDDVDAAERERQRVEDTHQKLESELGKLGKEIGKRTLR